MFGTKLVYSRYTVVSDPNHDGLIRPGEKVYIAIYLRNIGSQTAGSVRVAVITSSPYITSLSPTAPIDFGDIGGRGTEVTGSFGSTTSNNGYTSRYSCSFTVASTTPSGKISFGINMVDANNTLTVDTMRIAI
jgi:hypothetical protein